MTEAEELTVAVAAAAGSAVVVVQLALVVAAAAVASLAAWPSFPTGTGFGCWAERVIGGDHRPETVAGLAFAAAVVADPGSGTAFACRSTAEKVAVVVLAPTD